MKFKIFDKEKKEFWPEAMTINEIASSSKFPSNVERFYDFIPEVSKWDQLKSMVQINLQTLCDDREYHEALNTKQPSGLRYKIEMLGNIKRAMENLEGEER